MVMDSQRKLNLATYLFNLLALNYFSRSALQTRQQARISCKTPSSCLAKARSRSPTPSRYESLDRAALRSQPQTPSCNTAKSPCEDRKTPSQQQSITSAGVQYRIPTPNSENTSDDHSIKLPAKNPELSVVDLHGITSNAASLDSESGNANCSHVNGADPLTYAGVSEVYESFTLELLRKTLQGHGLIRTQDGIPRLWLRSGCASQTQQVVPEGPGLHGQEMKAFMKPETVQHAEIGHLFIYDEGGQYTYYGRYRKSVLVGPLSYEQMTTIPVPIKREIARELGQGDRPAWLQQALEKHFRTKKYSKPRVVVAYREWLEKHADAASRMDEEFILKAFDEVSFINSLRRQIWPSAILRFPIVIR